jgi:hypothetical protein
MTRPEIERLAVMESEIGRIKDQLAEMKSERRQEQLATSAQLSAIDGKLDGLTALRNKGIGAFWLASGLIGSGIIGTLVAFRDWLFHP